MARGRGRARSGRRAGGAAPPSGPPPDYALKARFSDDAGLAVALTAVIMLAATFADDGGLQARAKVSHNLQAAFADDGGLPRCILSRPIHLRSSFADDNGFTVNQPKHITRLAALTFGDDNGFTVDQPTTIDQPPLGAEPTLETVEPAPGSGFYTVPVYNRLTIKLWGPGIGGGGTFNSGGALTAPGPSSGPSTVQVGLITLSAGGATPSAPGVASGGDTNTNGNAALGNQSQGFGSISDCQGMNGADAPKGGTGGRGRNNPQANIGAGPGLPATAPGAGGGGAAWSTFEGAGQGTRWGSRGGHSGAYVDKVFIRGVTPGAPYVGAKLPYTVGTRGAPGPGTYLGGQGADGRIIFSTIPAHELKANFADDGGFAVSLAMAVNTGAGTATLSGTPKNGETLTCTWNDDDPESPVSGITYQWFRDAATLIAGATASTYTLTANDTGHTVKCRVRYVDAIGSNEEIFTVSSAVIQPGTVVITYTGADLINNDANAVKTFPNVNLGAAHPDRRLVFGFHWFNASQRSLDSVTLGGQPVTIHEITTNGGNGGRVAIGSIHYPEGTNANLVLTFSAGFTVAGSNGVTFDLWRCVGPMNPAPYRSYVDQSLADSNVDLECIAGGFLVCMVGYNNANGHILAPGEDRRTSMIVGHTSMPGHAQIEVGGTVKFQTQSLQASSQVSPEIAIVFAPT